MLIDANIFLEVLLKQEKNDACANFLRTVQKGEIKATITTFTIDGITLALDRHGQNTANIKIFFHSLFNYAGLRIYMPTMDDRLKAITHMALGLDFEDAITLQCTLSNNEKEIMSFDRDFDRIKVIKRIEPPVSQG